MWLYKRNKKAHDLNKAMRNHQQQQQVFFSISFCLNFSTFQLFYFLFSCQKKKTAKEKLSGDI